MSTFRFVVSCVTATGLLVGASGWSMAQEVEPAVPPKAVAPAPEEPEYEVMPLPEAIYANGKMTDATRNIETLVRKIQEGNQLIAQNEAGFDNFYSRFLFPLWTQPDPKNLADLPKERTKFLRNHVIGVKRAEVHDRIVPLTYRSMKEIVTKNYHPAVRYHAMMIIGELNTKEAVLSGPGSMPLPLSEALDFMMTELRNPKQIDAVRVAALLGILRHCDMNAYSAQQYPPAVRQGIVKQILPIAMEKKAPVDRSDDGHAWVRARAMEILGALGQSGFDASIVASLTSTISDNSEPIDVRLAAATSLGRLNLSAGVEVRGDEIARKIGELAVQAGREQLAVLDAEIAAEKERLKLEQGGGITGGGRFGPSIPTIGPRMEGAYAPGSLIPVKVIKMEQRMTLMQRLLKDRMIKTRTGLDGGDGATGAMSATRKPDQKQYVTHVRDAVITLGKASDVKDKVDGGVIKIVELAKEMRTRIADLERVTKTGGAPAVVVPPAPPVGAESPDDVPAEGPGDLVPMKKKGPAPVAPEGPEDEPVDLAPMPKKGPVAPPAEEGPDAP
jgi:hypothetical protein